MKVLVKSGMRKIWLDLPAIPQKGEELMFSMLKGMEGLTREEKTVAKESTAFLENDVSNINGCPEYIVTERIFHNSGIVELLVETVDKE